MITPVATTGTELGLPHQVEQQDEPGLVSFLVSERAKVVIMVALAMALCNADRVVMSVAIVPMAAAHGWSQSFSGVVQVRLLIHFSLPVLMVLLTFCKKCHFLSLVSQCHCCLGGISCDRFGEQVYSVCNSREVFQYRVSGATLLSDTRSLS